MNHSGSIPDGETFTLMTNSIFADIIEIKVIDEKRSLVSLEDDQVILRIVPQYNTRGSSTDTVRYCTVQGRTVRYRTIPTDF
jgi:hypothetical protein